MKSCGSQCFSSFSHSNLSLDLRLHPLSLALCMKMNVMRVCVFDVERINAFKLFPHNHYFWLSHIRWNLVGNGRHLIMKTTTPSSPCCLHLLFCFDWGRLGDRNYKPCVYHSSVTFSSWDLHFFSTVQSKLISPEQLVLFWNRVVCMDPNKSIPLLYY